MGIAAAVTMAVAVSCDPPVDNIVLTQEEYYLLDAGSTTVEIEFSSDFPWEASVAYFGYESDWIYLENRTGDTGTSNIILAYVSENYSGYDRKAAVNITDADGFTVTVTIEQTSEWGGGDIDTPGDEEMPENVVESVRVARDGESMVYHFGYDRSWQLSDIEISFDDGTEAERYTFYRDSYPIQVRYDYDGSSIFIYDMDGDGIAESLEVESYPGYVECAVDLVYDSYGHLNEVNAGYDERYTFLWDGDRLVETTSAYDNVKYVYSDFENNANLDLNWLFSDSYGSSFTIFPGLIDMLGARSSHYVIPDTEDPLYDTGVEHSPIPEDGTYTYMVTSEFAAHDEIEAEFDYDFRLNAVRTIIPIYTARYEYTVRRTIVNYDNYEIIDGVKMYYEYSEEVISVEEIDREKTSHEQADYEIIYY